MDRRTLLGLLSTMPLAAHLGPARAQAYPSKPIRILVGSAPGSVTDLAARLSAQILQDKYKQSAVVENRPGAGGVICMQQVAAAPADGYTLQLGGLGHNVIPAITQTGLPIDIPKAIMPIAQIAEFSNILVVRKDHPANTVQELIAYEKKRNVAITYGSNGVGSSSHMTSELFGMTTGLTMQHVPYKATNDALIGAVNGDLDLLFMNLPPTLPLLQAGRLKALGTTGGRRSRQVPEVPTMAEQGMSDFVVTSWVGLYGPSGIPAAITSQIADDIVAGFKTAEFQERLSKGGFEPKLQGVDGFAAWNKAELERWGAVARKAQISLKYGG